MNLRHQRFARHIGVLVSISAAIWALGMDGAAAPSPFAPDVLLDNQWHLKDRALEIGGANVRAAWPITQGAGIVIGIVDDGLQWTHPDLSPNYLASASFDFNFNDADPQPFPTIAHGTAVAGIAAARSDNTIGVSGVAPFASLAGLRLTAVAATDAQEASAFNFQPSVIHILNNSWNPSDNGLTLKAPGPLAAAARLSAVTTGRQGRGRIFVWSSGNGRLVSDDCNFDGYANSRFAIAVGASTDGANQVSTSEGCSALMVLAPSAGPLRGLTTTDLVGTPGYDLTDYTGAFGGTLTGGMNAGAPTVSGAVALMLARNQNLSWRDVQHIIRRTSVRITPTDAGWTTGAFPHSERLGFGLLDTKAAVDLAGQWTSVPAEDVLSPATRTLNLAIPDVSSTGLSDTITIAGSDANFVIEHIEVDFNATHTWRGDLQVKLTSPSGVASSLAPIRPSDGSDNLTNWRFGSVRHWGESAAGVWTLNVADRRFQDTGTWNNWTLRIYGYRVASTVPGAFGKSGPANGATGQSVSPTLNWTASSGVTNYEYCVDTTNDNACTAWTAAGTSTSAALSGLAAGTAYYWQVRANNASGATYADGAATAFWNFTTQLPLPGAFVKSSPGNGATGQSLTPTVSWGASAGVANYDYCYDTTNDNACSVWNSAGASTSVGLSGLAPGTTYYWQVRAVNGGGTTYANGAATAFWSFTTIALPGAFGHSSPSNGATGQSVSPTISWGASTGVANYDYCYDTTNDNACANWLGAGASTSVELSGLTPGMTYYWQVRAVSGGGTTYADGAATAFWSFTTGVLPGAFGHSSPATGASAVALTPTVSWGASANAVSYDYCYDTTNDNACSVWTGAGANTSAGLSGLTPGTTYYWQVRAMSGGGTTYANGSATAFWSFTTIALPGAFGHTSPANGASGVSLTPTVIWGASAGVANYDYCYDTTDDNACAAWIGAGSSTSVALSGLSPDTTYYWQVRAVNGGGTSYANGAATAFWSFTTIALPGAFSLSSPANGATGQPLTPTLSWGASAGAANYDYCYDTTNDNACANWTGAGSSTSVGLNGLTAGTLFYWQVRATNGGGTVYANASATAFWSFRTMSTLPAFGQVETPVQNAAGLQGAIAVTGWALDNVGVASIKIFRNCLGFEPGNCQTVLGNSLVFVGDAAFLEGARPDVAQAYPSYPNSTRAGWGYLLLTPLLPHVPNGQPYGGQGPITLYVVATDAEGNQTLLGRSTDPTNPAFAVPTSISVTNDTIAKPFGSIDTPTQGQTIGGVFSNFGWALTPDSNTISGDGDIRIRPNGSTMTVFIDGLPVALVDYDQCRGDVGNPVPQVLFCNDDVSTIFGNLVPLPTLTPRTSNPTLFRNLDAGRGAIGSYSIDTTTLANGVHTIAWSVTDTAGRTEGIGSRFFNVLNAAPDAPLSVNAPATFATVDDAMSIVANAAPATAGVFARSGFDLAEAWRPISAKGDRTFAVRLRELGRLELWLGKPVEAGYLVTDDKLQPLPVGSSLAGPVFAWMPPAGYVGSYQLVFVRGLERITVTVTITPKD